MCMLVSVSEEAAIPDTKGDFLVDAKGIQDGASLICPAVVLGYVGSQHIVGAIEVVKYGADQILEKCFPADLAHHV